jgi:magnesium-dependent phosphatase 1
MRHFEELQARTGLNYSDMLFFDDEARNADVGNLGVTFVLVGNEGATREVFDKGMEEWRNRQRKTGRTEALTG